MEQVMVSSRDGEKPASPGTTSDDAERIHRGDVDDFDNVDQFFELTEDLIHHDVLAVDADRHAAHAIGFAMPNREALDIDQPAPK